MERSFVRPLGILFAVAICAAVLLLGAPAAQAAPAAPDVVKTFAQPDGKTLPLRLWGDEFAHGWETLDRYTVAFNKATGYWEYAVRDASGWLAPSGRVVGADAPPAAPGLKPDVRVIEQERAAKGAPSIAAAPTAAPPWAGPDTDVLFIMVGFTDLPCTFTAAQMQTNMFGGGATGPGDLDDYYREISYGKLEIDGRVVGCYNLANNRSHYDDGPGSAATLVAEAVALADGDVDFSQFDNDGNNVVDSLGIIYAGGGTHDGCFTDDPPDGSGGDDLWPHSGSTGGTGTADGVTVNPYIINSEVTSSVTGGGTCNQMQTIGLFAHEFGHALGLPDLYDTDNSSEGVGFWSAMASQYLSTVNLADTPPHFDPWSKWMMGWVTPTDYTGQNVDGGVPQIEENGFVVQLLANPGGPQMGGSGEYFLVENRQQVKFDAQLPGCGLVIWHIEESQTNNRNEGHTTASHRLVDVEEADGLDELDTIQTPGDRGDAGDPFPGSSGNRLFADATYPTSNLYNGNPSGVRVANIGDCAPVMAVNFGNPTADVAITKTDSPDPVVAGEMLYYAISVVNNGPAAATNVQVIDVLPAGVTYQTSTGGYCTQGPPGTLTCNLGDMLSGATVNFTIQVQVNANLVANAGGPTSLTNTATVDADQADPVLTNNSSTAFTIVNERADLRVAKECKPDGSPQTPLYAGQTATCTITVDNLGPSTARNVSLVDTHLSNGTFSITGLSTTAGACATTANPQNGTGTVTCNLGNVSAGSRVTVAVLITANTPQDVNDRATASSITPDPNTANNEAADGVTFLGLADLALTKTASPTVIAGTQLTYDLSVTNNGPSSAVNVVIEDVLPAGVTIDSVSSSGGTCNAGVPGNAALPTKCTFDSMATGSSETMQIIVTVQPDVLGVLGNNAKVYSNVPDLDNSNNLATTSTTVTASADLSVTKTDYPDPVVAGTQLTYEVIVSNGGPSKAIDVTLTDTLPAGVQYQGYTVSNGSGTCSLLPVPPNTISCDLNDLNPGQNVKAILQVLVLSSVPDGTILTNTANVSAVTPDPNAANNTAAADTLVQARADLSITKDASVNVTNPSPRVTYTVVVRNNGASDALDVVMLDELPLDPKKIVFVFDTGNGACSYDQGTHDVTCNIGTLLAGQSWSVDIVVDVRGSVGIISNNASVSSSTVDPNTANNTVRKDVRIKGGPGPKK